MEELFKKIEDALNEGVKAANAIEIKGNQINNLATIINAYGETGKYLNELIKHYEDELMQIRADSANAHRELDDIRAGVYDYNLNGEPGAIGKVEALKHVAACEVLDEPILSE